MDAETLVEGNWYKYIDGNRNVYRVKLVKKKGKSGDCTVTERLEINFPQYIWAIDSWHLLSLDKLEPLPKVRGY